MQSVLQSCCTFSGYSCSTNQAQAATATPPLTHFYSVYGNIGSLPDTLSILHWFGHCCRSSLVLLNVLLNYVCRQGIRAKRPVSLLLLPGFVCALIMEVLSGFLCERWHLSQVQTQFRNLHSCIMSKGYKTLEV